jgi:hypothetical protein
LLSKKYAKDWNTRCRKIYKVMRVKLIREEMLYST